MITYTEFNRWCYNYYIHHNKDSEYGSLFIPPSDIDEFLGRDNAQDPIIFSEINNDWSYFLKTDKSENAIIKVFGIIALRLRRGLEAAGKRKRGSYDDRDPAYLFLLS